MSTSKFRFPLVFKPNIIFSTFTDKNHLVTNSGDVPTPVKLLFLGPSINPIITNVTTGKFIKINKNIASNETLEINTGYGKKTVVIINADGSKSNAFNFIDLNSTFWELIVGDNIITYDADSGAGSAKVYMYFSNRYEGV